jgi:hypothetical protein
LTGRGTLNQAQQKGVQQYGLLALIVFDVNETLLDLETMEPTFERIFGDKSAMRYGSPTSPCIGSDLDDAADQLIARRKGRA